MSPEAFAIQTHDRIRRYGYTMIGVESATPWAYTVGLIENHAHPELIVTGMQLPYGETILTTFADAVLEGDTFAPFSEAALDHGGGDVELIRFGVVDEGQWIHGRFDGWYDHYLRYGPQPKPGAVQVVLPGHSMLCQPLLDHDPGSNVHATNREGRRAAARRHRRRWN